MSYSLDRHRRGAKRLVGVIAAASVVGAGAIATTGVAYAEEDTLATALDSISADDFAAQAAELPADLKSAIKRDLGISAEQYLANAETAKVAADVAASLSAGGVGVAGVAVDGQDVTIYVSSEADADAVAQWGVNVEVGAPEKNDYSDYEFEAKADHKGGYGYAFEDGGYLFRCSVGFSGYTGSGADRFLTAGHCGLNDDYDEVGAPIHHIDLDSPIGDSNDWVGAFPGPALGDIVSGSFNFGPGVQHDGGLVDVTGAGWEGVPQVAGWGGGSGNPDADSVTIYDSIDAVVGAQACKSGATTGWTCGEITDAEVSVEFSTGEDVSGFVFDACMLGGDSGGSIVVGNYALGVNSGSTFQNCNSNGFGIGYAVSGGTYNAFDLFGSDWELNVEVNAPSIDSANADEEGATLRGTVENAGINHRVAVSVEGLGDFDADVDADGEFAIEIDETLEVGTEYNYTATAFYGNHSQSAATAGSFTVEEGEPEPEVEDLVVTSPGNGQTTSNPRPKFEGTGEPGAEVTLTVGDDEVGGSEISEDGAWEITPDSDLPRGERFDATVTQVAGEDVQSATVTDLGIKLPSVTITVPEEGDEVDGGVVFEGTSFPGAEIGLYLEGEIEASDEAAPAFGAASDEFNTAEEDEDYAVWEGEFEIDEDGNWSFAPAEALEDGEYTLTAMATLPDGDPELSDSETSVNFTVTAGGGGGGDDDGDDQDLPDTGSSSLPLILIGVGLLAAGGAAFAIRARRNASNA